MATSKVGVGPGRRDERAHPRLAHSGRPRPSTGRGAARWPFGAAGRGPCTASMPRRPGAPAWPRSALASSPWPALSSPRPRAGRWARGRTPSPDGRHGDRERRRAAPVGIAASLGQRGTARPCGSVARGTGASGWRWASGASRGSVCSALPRLPRGGGQCRLSGLSGETVPVALGPREARRVSLAPRRPCPCACVPDRGPRGGRGLQRPARRSVLSSAAAGEGAGPRWTPAVGPCFPERGDLPAGQSEGLRRGPAVLRRLRHGRHERPRVCSGFPVLSGRRGKEPRGPRQRVGPFRPGSRSGAALSGPAVARVCGAAPGGVPPVCFLCTWWVAEGSGGWPPHSTRPCLPRFLGERGGEEVAGRPNRRVEAAERRRP